MLELASHIVETKSGHFEPEKFEDHYEDALKELLKKKQAGEKIEAPKERAPAKVINLMDALRRSVETERDGSAKRLAASAKTRASESERPKKKKSHELDMYSLTHRCRVLGAKRKSCARPEHYRVLTQLRRRPVFLTAAKSARLEYCL